MTECSIAEKDVIVCTYIKKEIPNIIEDLERYRNDVILTDVRNKLKINYTEDRLDFLDQVAVSIARFENKIVSVSSLFHIPLYLNSSRSLNRYYQSSDFKKDLKKKETKSLYTPYRASMSQHAIEMIKQQSNICKTDFIFLSRQYPGRRVSQKTLRTLHEHESEDWYMPPDLYRVARGMSRSCWQYILIKQLKTTEFSPAFLNKHITEEKLLQKYHKIVKK